MSSPSALLKESTRSAHTATEDDFNLSRLFASKKTYIRLLEALLQTTQPLERAIDRFLGDAVRVVHPCEEMSGWLRADLTALGKAPYSGKEDSESPVVDSEAAALGVLYVMEGSMLGGQIIAQRLETALGIGPATGGRYYHGRGSMTMPHWRSVKSFIDGHLATPDNLESARRAALSTFELFGQAFRTALND